MSMHAERSELDVTLVPLADEEARARAALPIVERVAEQLFHRLGRRVPRDDLRSLGHAALVGLLRAPPADQEGVPLESYLRRRLRWAMLDGVRRETHGRAAAARARALEGMQLLSEDRPPRSLGAHHEPPSERAQGAALRVLLAAHATVAGVALLGGGTAADGPRAVAELAGDSGQQPERIVQRRGLVRALRAAVEGLADERQRVLVLGHYFEDERLESIAERLGLSPSRISRLHAAAIAELGERLRAVLADWRP
jgi:RNA polymerase sigma factor for flagellar operon FliA